VGRRREGRARGPCRLGEKRKKKRCPEFKPTRPSCRLVISFASLDLPCMGKSVERKGGPDPRGKSRKLKKNKRWGEKNRPWGNFPGESDAS